MACVNDIEIAAPDEVLDAEAVPLELCRMVTARSPMPLERAVVT